MAAKRRFAWDSPFLQGLLILGGIFLFTTSASAYYALTAPDEYSAEALVQFRPRPTDNGGVVGADTASSAAAGYAAYLGSPSTIQSVASSIGVPPDEFKDGVRARLIPATTSLTVGYETGDADLAALGANALAQSAVARAADDPLVSATVLAPAGVPGAPSGPLRTLIVLAGALLGVLLAAAAYFFRAYIDRSQQPESRAPAGERDALGRAPEGISPSREHLERHEVPVP